MNRQESGILRRLWDKEKYIHAHDTHTTHNTITLISIFTLFTTESISSGWTPKYENLKIRGAGGEGRFNGSVGNGL